MYLAAYIYDSMQTAWRIRQMETQQNYYWDRITEEERIRSIYFDLKNELFVLESRQNTDKTRRMEESLRLWIADYENYIHTGNEFTDILLKDNMTKTHEKKIVFTATADFHGMDFPEQPDISAIFGNAIDNALETSEKLPEDKRFITMKAGRIRDMLVITIENNTLPEASHTMGTAKADRFVHGSGLPDIRQTLEKYKGG